MFYNIFINFFVCLLIKLNYKYIKLSDKEGGINTSLPITLCEKILLIVVPEPFLRI